MVRSCTLRHMWNLRMSFNKKWVTQTKFMSLSVKKTLEFLNSYRSMPRPPMTGTSRYSGAPSTSPTDLTLSMESMESGYLHLIHPQPLCHPGILVKQTFGSKKVNQRLTTSVSMETISLRERLSLNSHPLRLIKRRTQLSLWDSLLQLSESSSSTCLSSLL